MLQILEFVIYDEAGCAKVGKYKARHPFNWAFPPYRMTWIMPANDDSVMTIVITQADGGEFYHVMDRVND